MILQVKVWSGESRHDMRRREESVHKLSCPGRRARLQIHSSHSFCAPSGPPQGGWMEAEIQHSCPCQAQRGSFSFPCSAKVPELALAHSPACRRCTTAPPSWTRHCVLPILGGRLSSSEPIFASPPATFRFETL